jgi:TetR/AcrR family fatty acid metabolism transcriptional regulator
VFVLSLSGFQATRHFCISKRGHFLNDFDKEQHSVVSEAQGSGTIGSVHAGFSEATMGKGLTESLRACYNLTMRIKNKPDGQNHPTFTEAARRTQIIECAIQTLATLGYAQASLAHIATRAGISKGVIVYYFSSKEELFEQVIQAIYTEGAHLLGPPIAVQPTSTLMLRTYIQTNVEYIGTHRLQMLAIREIVLNFRPADGKFRSGLLKESSILDALEAILRKGQQDGEFRAFDLRVMAITIRQAIDVVPRLLAANANLDVEAYARELVTLFDRATARSIAPQ